MFRTMKNWLKLPLSIISTNLVGIIGSIGTIGSISSWYITLNKPFFNPPNWIFGPVWTILYTLMGISLFLIWKQNLNLPKVKTAMNYFIAQLVLNFIWTPIFFGWQNLELALVVILGLWWLILKTIKKFEPVSKWAAWLLWPYLLWVSFATLLNLSLLLLN